VAVNLQPAYLRDIPGIRLELVSEARSGRLVGGNLALLRHR